MTIEKRIQYNNKKKFKEVDLAMDDLKHILNKTNEMMPIIDGNDDDYVANDMEYLASWLDAYVQNFKNRMMKVQQYEAINRTLSEMEEE